MAEARTAHAKVFVAREGFTTTLDGQEVTVHAQRTRVREGHPLLVGREHLFDELEVQYDLETATAAPAQKRGA